MSTRRVPLSSPSEPSPSLLTKHGTLQASWGKKSCTPSYGLSGASTANEEVRHSQSDLNAVLELLSFTEITFAVRIRAAKLVKQNSQANIWQAGTSNTLKYAITMVAAQSSSCNTPC